MSSARRDPRGPTNPRRPLGIERFAVVYTCYKEVMERRIGADKLVETLKQCSVRDCISVLFPMLLSFEIHGIGNRDLHAPWTRMLFLDSVGHRILVGLSAEANRLVFSPEQLLALMKLAFLFCDDEAEQTFQQSRDLRERFAVNCLLGITDYLGGARAEEESQRATTRGQDREILFRHLARLELFYATYNDKFVHLLPRYYDLFLRLAQSDRMRESPQYSDLAGAFEEATGLDLRAWLSLGFGIATRYIPLDFADPDLDPQRLRIFKHQWFRHSDVSEAMVETMWQRLALDAQGFRGRLQKEIADTGEFDTEHFSYSMLTFRDKPLFAETEETFVPLSLYLLEERIAGGVFWQISDFLRQNDREEDWWRFRSFFGHLFHQYVTEVFARLDAATGIPGARFFPEFTYGKPEKPTWDIAWIDPGKTIRALLIEVVATRPRMIGTAIQADMQTLEEDLDRIVIEKAGQIDRVLRDFQARRFTLGGFHFWDIDAFYPVVVTIVPPPRYLLMGRYIEERLGQKGLLQQRKVNPLQVISAYELEMLEPIITSGVPLSEILKRKILHDVYRYGPLTGLLRDQFAKNGQLPENQYLAQVLDELTPTIARFLFPKRDNMPES